MNLPDASTRHTITKLPIRLINCNSTELRLCFVFLLLLTTTTLFFVLIWQYEPTWTPFPKPIQFVLTENESTIDIKYKPFPKNFIIQTLSPIPNLPAIDFQLKQIVNFSQKQLKIRTFKTQIEKLVQQKFNRTTNEFPVLFERINRGYCYQGFRANDTHLTLTIVIKSRLDDFKRRHHIRNSWGWKERKLINVKLNVLFAIGSCAFIDASCEQAIQTEQDDHGDLIQGDFKDTYNNNTLKTIMIFKWFNDYCAKTSDYLLIVDDDFYVSIKNLIIHITQTSFEDKKMPSELKSDILGPQFDPREKHLYSGFVIRNSAPFRDPNNKWFVSYQEYPFLRYPGLFRSYPTKRLTCHKFIG